MRKSIRTLAAIALLAGGTALGAQSATRPGEAGAALSAGERAMVADDSSRLESYVMATDWVRPGTQGRNGAILSAMRTNHVFARHLTTGDFRQDLLVGFDSKANLKVAVLDDGMGDSCEALAKDTFGLQLKSRAGDFAVDTVTTRTFETGETKGCFVQIIARFDELRGFLNQAGDQPVSLELTVSDEKYPVFASLPGGRKRFWQPASLLKLRQNFAVTGG